MLGAVTTRQPAGPRDERTTSTPARIGRNQERWPPLLRTAGIVSICIGFWAWVAYEMLR